MTAEMGKAALKRCATQKRMECDDHAALKRCGRKA